MRPESVRRARWRRGPLAMLGLTLLALLPAAAASAEPEDRALSALGRSEPARERQGTSTPLQWERVLRAANSFGPRPLRPQDAALLQATRSGDWAAALELLKSGRANPNARDEAGAHALVPAARGGQDTLVRELLQRGAEIDRAGEDGFTALGAAALQGQRSVVRQLVRAGADVTRGSNTGQTALHLASLAGHVAVVKELLALRVDIELLNRQRESALDVASGADQQAVMELLIERGADYTRAGRR